MRVLLDENVPVDIIPVLRAGKCDAESINFIGWKGIQNGELMKRAREGFDLLITRDKDFDQEFLRNYVNESFGIVLLAIPQQPGPAYAQVFAILWPPDAQSFVGKVSRLGI
jgi:predicted nuclease of predicted toxin-antitoxin system